MQPESPSLTTKLMQSAPRYLRRAGFLGAGLGLVLVSLKNLHKLVGVEETELPSEDFAVKTPFSKWTKWNPEPDRDQVVKVDAIADDGRTLLEIGAEALERGRSIKVEAELYTRSTGEGHAYEINTKTVLLPKERLSDAANPKNHNWFRGKLSGFAPHGRQLPQTLPQIEFEPNWDDPYDPMPVMVRKQNHELTVSQAIDQFDRETWALNTPVVEHVSLGWGGNVVCRPSGVITDTQRKLIVRYGYMSTLIPHPLDGRALWGNVVNYETGEMAGFYIGAGKHKVSTVDWLNQPIAAFVFLTMFRTWTWLLQQPGHGTPTLVGCDPIERRRLLAKLHREQPNLTLCRTIAYALDAMAMGGGILRGILGADIIDAPFVAEGTKIEVIGEKPYGPDHRIEEVVESRIQEYRAEDENRS